MFSLKKKIKGTAEVQLAYAAATGTPAAEDKVWRSNEDITGSAVYRLPPGVEFSQSKIMLKGIVTTRTEDARRGSLQPGWRTEKLAFLAVSLDSRARQEFRSDNGVVRIPFRFNLDNCGRFSAVTDFPPSVDSKEDAQWWSSLKKYDARYEYTITYSITAAAYSTRGLIASTTQKISVLPVAEAQPPLYPSHFPGEYFVAASSPREGSKHHSKRSPVGPRFEVSGQEPEPLKLDPSSTSSQGSLEVPFVVKLLPREGFGLDRETLPRQCELKARLVTRTLVTPNGSKTVPTVQDVLNDDEAYVRTFRSNEQAYTLSIPEWIRYGDRAEEQFAITNFPFLFNIDGGEEGRTLSPSFFTPILTRRYAIEIELKLAESSGASLELSLPMQVVYEATDTLDLTRVKSDRRGIGA